MEWISVLVAVPSTRSSKTSDSETVIIYNENNGDTATAWYNQQSGAWTLSHSSTHSECIIVTHWMPLPEPPKQ